MAKITILGGGTWGVALSRVITDNGHDLIIWSKIESEIEELSTTHKYKNLPGFELPAQVKLTLDAEEAVKDRDVLIMAVASPYVRSTAHLLAPYIREGQLIVNVAKGIEADSLLTMTGIIKEEIPQSNVAVLSGPSHAEEVCKAIPTTIVVGANKKETAEYLQDIFMNPNFRTYISNDMLGIELGASLKNVIALAAGMVEGLGYGDNTLAALITRGIAEITRLGTAMGGHIHTFYGLSGIGDLIVTCASKHSRNRMAGYYMGQGLTAKQAMDKVQQIVEGVHSTKAAKTLSEKYGVEMPIVSQVYEIVFNDKSVKEAFSDLMNRNGRAEYYGIIWEEEGNS
ncbi:MAG: NAD(P)-dependent glycerol-3-phosphate dehydrogenase [Lachnospiraceae bacterium]|nr:NAD(P)-dependent glycerol-3-phosphate dehydrogenase [Lachnospiraceae bacterium]